MPLLWGETLKGYLDGIGNRAHEESQPLINLELLNSGIVDAIVEHADTEQPLIASLKPGPNSTTGDRTPP